MKETIMSEYLQAKATAASPLMRRVIVYGGVLLVIFLLGFVPMWLKARSINTTLVETQRQLIRVSVESSLAAAAIEARRGDYEPARQAASQFFTLLRAEIDKGDTSNFTRPEREGLQPLFAGRDVIITLLARNDPASADRLSDLYVAYRKIVSR
jgi:hypothetical protein